MATEVKDIRVDDTNDVEFRNGDFFVGASDVQHVDHIIEAFPGHFKQFPLMGVGVSSYRNSSGTKQQLENAIRLNMEADGYNVNGVDIITDNGIINAQTKIYIDGNRIKNI
jgi:hypothetical protein